MKQIKDLAWMSAIALAGTITFAACSSDDDKVQNINPTYDGKSVKTQFAINIPRAAQTRQTGAIVQEGASPTFRGMQDVVIFSAKADPASANTILNNVSLNATTITNNELSNNQKIYSDVTIPIGTTHFLFYGQATKGQGVSNAANGVLTLNTNTNNGVSDINGSLKVISADATLANDSLKTILNGISGVDGWSTTDHVGLKTAYTGFTSLKSGSAYSILKEVERLYNNLITIETTEIQAPTVLINAIKTKITESFNVANNSLTYKTESTFPEYLGLPQGSAVLEFTAGNFSYQASSAIGAINGLKPNTICFPAALYYRANTTLYASDNESVTWPASLKDWNKAESWPNSNWANTVSATTRTIALKDNINYAVALLKTTVKIGENVSTLDDNAQSKGNQASNQQIPVEVGSGESATPSFNLTGVLIGGQPTQVNWEFLPTSDNNRTYTIYDNVMNGTIGVTSNTTPNYTMVLDNLMSGQDASQASINMAIELQNNSGTDFYGVDGIVPNGGKFYLVANLDMSNKTLDGVSKPHVFMQDYTTTADLTITSLKNAYMTIPDLRSTQLKLGLSVDLEWKAGLTFDVTID